jgi:hypothetical protein
MSRKAPQRAGVSDAKVDDPPPLLGTWRNLYIFVLLYLVVVIFLSWLFTRHYAPVS